MYIVQYHVIVNKARNRVPFMHEKGLTDMNALFNWLFLLQLVSCQISQGYSS